MARTYKRDSWGRFSGSGGGSAPRPRTSGAVAGRAIKSGGAGGTAVRRSSARSSSLGSRVKGVASNRKVQAAALTVGVGVGGYVAYNKVNPGTSLRRSGISVPGDVMRYGGSSAARPQHSIIHGAGGIRYTTTSNGKGFNRSQHTTIERIGGRGAVTPIGYVDSNRALLGGYRVSHTYLTPSNRGQGLGKQAMAAHAAHRPNRVFRASMNRSNMGQAFAKSMGAAGVRSGKSTKAGSAITRQLDTAWRQSTKADRSALSKNVNAATKGMKPHKMPPGRSMVSGKKLKR